MGKLPKSPFSGIGEQAKGILELIHSDVCGPMPVQVTRRNLEVVDLKQYRVKNYSKLTNFRKFTRIEGYNGKYGSNPQGIKEFLDSIFKFDQIG